MSFFSSFKKISLLILFFEIASYFVYFDPELKSSFFIYDKLLIYLEIIKNIIFQIFRYGIPNVFCLILTYNFFLYMRKKIIFLKEIKSQMAKQTKNTTLEYYQNKMSIMKNTLLTIIGYLFSFGIISSLFFSESLLMENILFFNIALIMTTLLEVSPQENPNQLTKNMNFFINFLLIFITAFFVNDVVYWLTGVKAFI